MKAQAKKAAGGLRALLSNPTEKKTMATKKRKKKSGGKRRAAKKNPATRKRRRSVSGPLQAGARRRRSRRSNPGRKTAHHGRRRRRNPSMFGFGGGGKMSSAKTAAKAIVGGLLGLVAGRLIESRISQPAKTMAAIEIGTALVAAYLGAKTFKQPELAYGFAAGLGGVQGGGKLLDAFTTPAPAPAPASPQVPATTDGSAAAAQMAAVTMRAIEEGGDLEGAEGMAAVESAPMDENDPDAPADFSEAGGYGDDPFAGSVPAYG